MTPSDATRSTQAVYDFWLGLIPQFLGQFGAAPGTTSSTAATPLPGFLFPADQIAKAASMTQQSMQALAQLFAPMLQSGGPSSLLGQWGNAMSGFGAGKAADATGTATTAAQAMLAPWNAWMSGIARAVPAAAQGSPSSTMTGLSSSVLPLQAMNQAWIDFGSRLAGTTPEQVNTAFERTYGALSDALGFGPARQLQAAWQDVVAASIAQQEARANYAVIVQSAFAEGLQRMTARLAGMAGKGERIDSVLALIRLWALCTEEVVHETLQSERGLAATAALTRSSLAYRKKMRLVTTIIADWFDLTTRRDLDEAYREIQALKRELRSLRPAQVADAVDAKSPRKLRTRARGKPAQSTSDDAPIE